MFGSERIGLRTVIAANMSGITTTQSKIAEDLDAFASASWFTSAYLVSVSIVLRCRDADNK